VDAICPVRFFGIRFDAPTLKSKHEPLALDRTTIRFVWQVTSYLGNPAFVPRRPSRERLEELTWISREEGSATRSLADAAMARLGIVPRRRLQLPSYEAVVYALKSGYGIAAMNRYVVAEELRLGLLAVISVRGWNVRSVLSVLRVRDARVTPLADEFQTLVRNRLNEIVRARARERRR